MLPKYFFLVNYTTTAFTFLTSDEMDGRKEREGSNSSEKGGRTGKASRGRERWRCRDCCGFNTAKGNKAANIPELCFTLTNYLKSPRET